MIDLLIIGIVFAISLVSTGFLHRYALNRSLLDIPNARSSHDVPTPRGGGLAIVFSFICGLLYLFFVSKTISTADFAALFGGKQMRSYSSQQMQKRLVFHIFR